MFRPMFVAMVMLLPLAAPACDLDEKLLTNYIGLTKALRANGVEPNTLDWSVIESMCLGLKTEKNRVPYNRCRFETALNQALFPDDRAACLDDAQRTSVDTTMSATAIHSVVSQQSLTASPSYSSCMRALGWRSPNNWQRGRVTESARTEVGRD